MSMNIAHEKALIVLKELRGFIYSYGRRFCCRVTDIDDIMQECFIKLVHIVDEVKEEKTESHYFKTCLANNIVDRFFRLKTGIGRTCYNKHKKKFHTMWRDKGSRPIKINGRFVDEDPNVEIDANIDLEILIKKHDMSKILLDWMSSKRKTLHKKEKQLIGILREYIV